MENKELEKNAPVELDEDALKDISAGTNQQSQIDILDDDTIKDEVMLIIPIV